LLVNHVLAIVRSRKHHALEFQGEDVGGREKLLQSDATEEDVRHLDVGPIVVGLWGPGE
jgi:hypothetical protein